MRNRQIRLAWVCGVFCAGGLCLAGERPDYTDPPQGVFVDEWMSVEMMGGKVGFAHNEYVREGDKVRTSMLMTMTLKRAQAEVNISVVQTTLERLDGTPMEFTNQMNMSNQVLEKRGVIANGKVRITSRQFGVVNSAEYDFPGGAMMSWGIFRKLEEMGYEKGTTYTVQMYEPTMGLDTAVEVEVEIHGPDTITVDGKPVEAIRTSQKMMGLVTTGWIDADGHTLRTELNMAGVPMVMTRTTKAQAMLDIDPPEFFMPTTIEVKRPIDRERAKKIVYRLALRDKSQPMASPPDTAMQQVLENKDGKVRLAVQRLDHAALKNTPPRKYGAEFAEYLESNPIINSADPAVMAMAKAARGDAKTPYEIADRLRRYVTDEIREKNLDVGFATASEVCRDKAGDCSEHAVLLAALGRANGLPSRVATGLVYVPIFGGSENIFGFHMWTQFLIGDTWVDFDAAQRESDCNATHIAFNVSSLAKAGLGPIAFALVNIVGNLDLEIEEIVTSAEAGPTE